MPEARNLTATYTPLIDAAIAAHGQGEPICWESGLVPGANGAVVFVVFFWMPGAVLGTVVNGSMALANPLGSATTEFVDTEVARFLDAMRTERSKSVSGLNGSPPSKIILPGQ